MSRVATPDHVIPTWATGSNYPAGPDAWNGLAIKTAPAIVYFTPDVRPAAEDLNYLIHKSLDTGTKNKAAIVALYDDIGDIAVRNWPYSRSETAAGPHTTTAGIGGVAWHAQQHQWVMTTDSGTDVKCWYSYSGTNWIQVGTTPAHADTDFTEGLVCSPTGGQIVFSECNTAGAAGATNRINTWNGSWTSTSFDKERCDLGFWFDSKFVLVGRGRDNNQIVSYSSTDGASWTPYTILTSVADRVTEGWVGCVANMEGTTPRLVLLPRGHVLSGAENAMIVFSAATTATVSTNAPEAEGHTGICFHQPSGQFFATAVGSGGSIAAPTRIYTSAFSDPTSWTLVATIVNTVFTSIESWGELLLATVLDTTSKVPGVVLSRDRGATWEHVRACDLDSDSRALDYTTAWNPPRLCIARDSAPASSIAPVEDKQACVFTGRYLRFSLASGKGRTVT
jgi:hypothetical protein